MDEMIQGKISDRYVEGSLSNYSIAGIIASKYSTYRDSIPKIYLFEDYSFDYVYREFLNSSLFSPISRVKKDILVSLCFNPFFEQFYCRIKEDHKSLTHAQKRMLYNGFLKHYSQNSTKKMMETEDCFAEKDIQDVYLKNSAFEKCNELIDMFGLN